MIQVKSLDIWQVFNDTSHPGVYYNGYNREFAKNYSKYFLEDKDEIKKTINECEIIPRIDINFIKIFLDKNIEKVRIQNTFKYDF